MSYMKRFTVMMTAILMFGGACVFLGYAYGSVTANDVSEIVEAAPASLVPTSLPTLTPVPTSLPTSTPVPTSLPTLIPPTSTPAN